MASVLAVDSYRFSERDGLLIDANVWLDVYGPQAGPGDRRVRVYSGALARCLKAGSTIAVDVLVVSEFINRYARYGYSLYKQCGGTESFKQFRDSEQYKPIAGEIADAARRVIGHCSCTGSCFESVDIDAVLTAYSDQACDFSDQMIAEVCRQKGLKLMTHDGDFRGSAITILTDNRRLLAS